jgi:hypothetical protein
VSGVSFTDTTAGATDDVYMVRAIKLENTPSGTYYNASQGAFGIGFAGESIRLGVQRGAAGLQLTWNSRANSRYRVQSTTNFTTWTDAQTVTATGSTTSWTNSSPSASQLIYRVVAE